MTCITKVGNIFLRLFSQRLGKTQLGSVSWFCYFEHVRCALHVAKHGHYPNFFTGSAGKDVKKPGKHSNTFLLFIVDLYTFFSTIFEIHIQLLNYFLLNKMNAFFFSHRWRSHYAFRTCQRNGPGWQRNCPGWQRNGPGWQRNSPGWQRHGPSW